MELPPIKDQALIKPPFCDRRGCLSTGNLKACALPGCTKNVCAACMVKFHKKHKELVALQNGGAVCSKLHYQKVRRLSGARVGNGRPQWSKDGKTGAEDPNSSEAILLRWLTAEGNYDRFCGNGDGAVKSKKYGIAEEIRLEFIKAGTRCNRSAKDVLNKIRYLETTFQTAHDMFLAEAHLNGNVDKTVKKCCPWYFDLVNFMAPQTSALPKVTTADRSEPAKPSDSSATSRQIIDAPSIQGGVVTNMSSEGSDCDDNDDDEEPEQDNINEDESDGEDNDGSGEETEDDSDDNQNKKPPARPTVDSVPVAGTTNLEHPLFILPRPSIGATLAYPAMASLTAGNSGFVSRPKTSGQSKPRRSLLAGRKKPAPTTAQRKSPPKKRRQTQDDDFCLKSLLSIQEARHKQQERHQTEMLNIERERTQKSMVDPELQKLQCEETKLRCEKMRLEIQIKRCEFYESLQSRLRMSDAMIAERFPELSDFIPSCDSSDTI